MSSTSKVIEVFKTFAEGETNIDAGTPIYSGGLGMNSMSVLDVMMELEEAFSIQIPGEAVSSFKVVGDVITFVDKAVAG